MNNQISQTSEPRRQLVNTISPTLLSFMLILVSAISSSAQAIVTWHYVATLPGGVKSYLNEELKVLPNKNKVRWEKLVKPDGSSAIALVEWDCAAKLRLSRQITFYNADQSVIGTKKTGFDWMPIIPGTAADFLDRRICSVIKIQTAEIARTTAQLRTFPNDDAPIAKVAKRGDKFQIVPESGQGGWFNIVDAATQEDYWLLHNQFRTIEAEQSPQKPNGAGGSRRGN